MPWAITPSSSMIRTFDIVLIIMERIPTVHARWVKKW
jgi:hypothetical protein